MKSIVGLILAGCYLVLVAALLLAWVFLRESDQSFPMWQEVGGALFLLVLPWSISWFFMISIEEPLLTDIAYVGIHAIGGLINASIIYLVCTFISYVVRKLTRPDAIPPSGP